MRSINADGTFFSSLLFSILLIFNDAFLLIAYNFDRLIDELIFEGNKT